jgi:hypothetical protein
MVLTKNEVNKHFKVDVSDLKAHTKNDKPLKDGHSLVHSHGNTHTVRFKSGELGQYTTNEMKELYDHQ